MLTKREREVARLSQRRCRNKIRDKIKAVKAKSGCGSCDEKDPVCLVFHHKNPNNKSFGIQKACSAKVPRKLVVKEMKKCIILCMNCHAKLHYLQFVTKIQKELDG